MFAFTTIRVDWSDHRFLIFQNQLRNGFKVSILSGIDLLEIVSFRLFLKPWLLRPVRRSLRSLFCVEMTEAVPKGETKADWG